MTAKQYLLQYRDALMELKCKEAERQTLIERATSTAPSMQGGAPVIGSITDKTGRGAANVADLDREIEAEEKALNELLSSIRRTISQVPDVSERNLLTYYYVCGYTWEQTAVEMAYSYSHVVSNLHPSALRKVTVIIRKAGIK